MICCGLEGPEITSWWGWDFHMSPDWPCSLPNLLYNGYWVSSLGVKQPRHGIDHPCPSPCSAKVKERLELYLYSPSGPSWPAQEWTLPISLYFEHKWFWNEKAHDCPYHPADLSLLTFLLAKLLLLQILAFLFTSREFSYLFCIWNLFLVFYCPWKIVNACH
jgi:hypothetical protein